MIGVGDWCKDRTLCDSQPLRNTTKGVIAYGRFLHERYQSFRVKGCQQC